LKGPENVLSASDTCPEAESSADKLENREKQLNGCCSFSTLNLHGHTNAAVIVLSLIVVDMTYDSVNEEAVSNNQFTQIGNFSVV
jgi:hypothetical protein